jgi:hypothetical protein
VTRRKTDVAIMPLKILCTTVPLLFRDYIAIGVRNSPDYRRRER